MRAFDYVRAERVDDVVAALADPDTKCLAGGTNLLDLMKGHVETPSRLVDITRLPLRDIETLPDGGMRIGTLVRNSDLANDPTVRERYPLLAQALVAGASPQLRNMATVGGNLLQRTRCHYFTDIAFAHCNKRRPGSGCAAREGANRIHAILGASEQCIAVHPSDMCVALAALDAVVEVRSSRGVRRIPMSAAEPPQGANSAPAEGSAAPEREARMPFDPPQAWGDPASVFHRLPGDAPERDTELRHDELITAVALPPSSLGAHSHYLKVRDRASYEFALVSVAVGLELDGDKVKDARIALGGVAHRPWRASGAERALIGRAVDGATCAAAGGAATAGARPYADNAFKVTLAQRAVARAIREAARG